MKTGTIAGWKEARLGDHVDIQTGFPFKSKNYTEDPNGTRLLRGDNIVQGNLRWDGVKRWPDEDSNVYQQYSLSENDVVLAMDRPWIEAGLKYAWITKRDLPCLLVQRVARLRGIKGLSTDYVRYIIGHHSFTDYVKGIWTGVAVPHISESQIRAFSFLLPPSDVQERITHILGAYDGLIENNTRRIEILEEMTQMLYREWFVNFRFPGCEKVKMVDSELGSIPEDWRAERLENLASITMGQSPSSERYNEVGDGLPFHQGVTNFGSRFPVDRIFCTMQTRVGEAGDILMSVRAPVGRLNITLKKIVIGRGLCAIRSRLGLQELLFQQLKERFLEEDTMGSGTIFKAVTKEDVKGLKFIQPSREVARRFVEQISPSFRQLEVLTAMNLNLRNTRNLLLLKLVSGKIRVGQIESEVGAQTV